MNWNTIANVSAIVTCTSFIFYLIGHIWTIFISKNKIFEQLNFEEEDQIDVIDFDFGKECGQTFSICSPEGIKSIKIFEAILDAENGFSIKKGDLLKEFKNIKPNKKIYIRTHFTDISSNLCLEITRADYIKTSFIIADNGKDGCIAQLNYKNRMTALSWIYYLCK